MIGLLEWQSIIQKRWIPVFITTHKNTLWWTFYVIGSGGLSYGTLLWKLGLLAALMEAVVLSEKKHPCLPQRKLP